MQPPSPSVVATARKTVFDNVNDLLQRQCEGRLFAIVHLCGKQFKVTAGDIILVEGYWPPAIGDKIRLDKVSLVNNNIELYIIHYLIILLFEGSASWRRGLYTSWSTTSSKRAGRRTGYHYREDFDPHENTFP